MRNIRPLARVPAVVGGESFASYVERLAACHQVDLIVMLEAIGTLAEDRYEKLNGYGILLSKSQIEKFSIATKISKQSAAKMVLAAYDGVAFNLQGVQTGDADALRKRAVSEWAYFSGSHMCPHCVREDDGAWQLAWKLPWSFVCPKHKCYYIARCPACERRLATGRTDRSLSPLFVRKVPNPGSCGNPMPYGIASAGRSATPCGHLLTDVPTTPAGNAILRVQETLNNVLDGEPPPILGALVSSMDYFRDLRSLCALVLYCAEPSDLGKIAEVEVAAFSAHALERNRILVERAESAMPRNSARSRVFSGPPETPELMAAVTGLAVKILACENVAAMTEILRPLAQRCIARSSKFRWEIIKFFQFSDRIAPAFHESLAERSTFDRAIGSRSVEAKATKYAVEPRHIPQLFWSDDFDAHFEHFFPNVQRNFAQRFCSMSLVKLCEGHTWGEAALLLGLPEHSSIKMANKCVGLLATENVKKEFRAALHALATRLSAEPSKIDFALRRASLAKFVDIPKTPWIAICSAGGITPGQLGRRSKYAAAWLWADLTGGDWTLAPALEKENTVNSREVYRSMSKNILPKVRSGLEDYGLLLLQKEVTHEEELLTSRSAAGA